MNKVSQQSNLLTSLSKTVEVLQHFSAAIDKDHKAMISGMNNSQMKLTSIVNGNFLIVCSSLRFMITLNDNFDIKVFL